MWPIVSTALAENRHELVLSGAEVSKLLTENGFDERVYELERLNFLEISQSVLDCLSEKIDNLTNLAQLGLSSNRLRELPATLGNLQHLRFLDVSFNNISALPDGIFSKLNALNSLNLSGNQLESIPDVGKLTALQELRCSNNKLKVLPEGIHLLTSLILLDASQNELTLLPSDISDLKNLKTADFSTNKLVAVPYGLHQCRKLHDLRLQNNPLKDNRLRKLASDPHSAKAVFDYLRRLDEANNKTSKSRGKNTPSKQAEASDEVACSPSDVSEALPAVPHILIQRPDESENYQISQDSSVKDGPRPYLIACTIHGVVFKSPAHLKSFTRAQEDWHRGLGHMRRRATLATHDLRGILFPLTFTMQRADEIDIHVLNETNPSTGDKFLNKLYHEAEADRKTKKQAKFSQLYRYLNLLNLESHDAKCGFKDNQIPVIKDASGTVISMPPLTNSHQTRLSETSTDILIEVTGASLAFCKEMAEAVIAWLLENACPTTEDRPTTTIVSVPPNTLVVRPIRVIDSESTSQLNSIYPSRLDLVAPKFNTVR